MIIFAMAMLMEFGELRGGQFGARGCTRASGETAISR